jgi:hypothetical protein
MSPGSYKYGIFSPGTIEGAAEVTLARPWELSNFASLAEVFVAGCMPRIHRLHIAYLPGISLDEKGLQAKDNKATSPFGL